MTKYKRLMCAVCATETTHIHNSGWWRCSTCNGRTERAKLGNTNSSKGEDRAYDASGEAHNKIAKGSHGNSRKNHQIR